MPEQIQKLPIENPGHKQVQDEGGPKMPNFSKPDTGRILKKMRAIIPDQARKFRQKSGE